METKDFIAEDGKKFFIEAQVIYDLREEFEFCSGTELHFFFRQACDGEPSPSGQELIYRTLVIQFVAQCCDEIRSRSPSIKMGPCMQAVITAPFGKNPIPDLSGGGFASFYTHDCDFCVYLGSVKGVDLYFHPGSLNELIARFGEDGDYASSCSASISEPPISPDPFLQEAHKRSSGENGEDKYPPVTVRYAQRFFCQQLRRSYRQTSKEEMPITEKTAAVALNLGIGTTPYSTDALIWSSESGICRSALEMLCIMRSQDGPDYVITRLSPGAD